MLTQCVDRLMGEPADTQKIPAQVYRSGESTIAAEAFMNMRASLSTMTEDSRSDD